MSSVSSSAMVDDVRADRACFDGMLLACLAFGALMILYIQLIQVLRGRPKRRGRIFWGIILYSSAMLPLATLSIIGKITFAELTYITHRLYPAGPRAYYFAHLGQWPNVMTQICTTVLPWIADVLMLYRLMVFWNYRRWVVIFPGLLYLAHVSISIPLLLTTVQSGQPFSSPPRCQIVYYSLYFSFNLVLTILICLRIFMMRHKAVKVLGKLQASFYVSLITLCVESGAFFTIWSMVYLICFLRNSWVQHVFLQPYSYILAITRILIVMRMARDRAWSRDIISATMDGELDWQISSTRTIPHDLSEPSGSRQSISEKITDDSPDSCSRS